MFHSSWLCYVVQTRSNTQCRRVDRAEVRCLALVALAVLFGLWQIARVVPAVYNERIQLIAEQTATVRTVEAQALEPIHGNVHRDGIAGRVQWTEGGVLNEAVATVRRPADAGEGVQIWVDHHGDVAEPPPTKGEARGYTGGVVLAAIFGVFLCGVAASVIVRRVCDYVRDRAWGRALRRLITDDGCLGQG